MSYYIQTDLQIEDENLLSDLESLEEKSFPTELSYFFEQYGGFAERSEVAQVSDSLKIDLSLFQNTAFDFEEDERQETWQEINAVLDKIKELLMAIEKNEAYYKKIRYGTENTLRFDSFNGEITADNIVEAIEQELKKKIVLNDPYPNDHGYLSENRITSDLLHLQNLLRYYKTKGVLKMRFVYR